MTDYTGNSGQFADDMAEYLQAFIDETEEQLDDLVETMLVLERDSTSSKHLNESFRLIHSIKGSAGMMGLDNITSLTHHLENRFERFRSGTEQLDEKTMNLVLRCIDFLRQCNDRLRDGERLGSPAELLDELRRLEAEAAARHKTEQATVKPDSADSETDVSPPPPSPDEIAVGDDSYRLVVCFRPGLPLSDLKAQLIVSRLSSIGEVKSTHPDVDHLSNVEQLDEFEIRIESDEEPARLRAAANVEGVESIEIDGVSREEGAPDKVSPDTDTEAPTAVPGDADAISDHTAAESKSVLPDETAADVRQEAVEKSEPRPSEQKTASPQPAVTASATEKTPSRVVETMRVDIDRLDILMNLAGELVVNRARFVQISGQVSPALRKASMVNRIRDFSDGLRRTIDNLENGADSKSDSSAQIQLLRAGLELMDEQSEIWDNGRQCFSQISEAIDQLSRVSHSLQRGVLDTRMVPVGPLFNRFKRVVRDLSVERGKKVNLLIRGEKTELDKRMIDELGDPLVHLVRNSMDHGLEPPDVRVRRGKPEAGTILLEASHSGNNVYIHVRDDGGGIDVAKIKAKIVDRRLLSESAVDELSDAQALDYIWNPGFSTAKEVTDVSGRGVGMDVVKTRIHQLNGTIEVDSTPQRGTTFALRLPLTLAIIDSLLVQLRGVVFAMPIDDVREIVSVKERDVVRVHGNQTFDVRGEFIPLVSIDDIFQWHGISYGHGRPGQDEHEGSPGRILEVVILHAGGKTLGLRVDELMGSQDIVIKSLSDNFTNIRGLSGASILGDGSVCLMLDVGTVIDMATRPARTEETEEVAT